MSKDRTRNKSNRRAKRVILIACEGKNKTERNYFNGFAGRDKDYVIKIVPGNETDPVSLVKQTINKLHDYSLNIKDDDRAFCVFDTDTDMRKNTQINAAVKLARDNGINVITSCPCIELWFLLHFEYTTAFLDNSMVLSKLKKYIPEYMKNYNIYPKISRYMFDAIKHAQRLEKYQLGLNRKIISVGANPHSDVYKVLNEFDIDNN